MQKGDDPRMINDTHDRLGLFLSAIREAAEESCRQKEQETAEYIRSQKAQAEEEAHARHKQQYEARLRQVRINTDRELSAYRAVSRNRLSGLRSAYETSVFRDAAQAILAYTGQPEYAALLERSARRMAALLPAGTADAVLYLRPQDMPHADRVRDCFALPCRVEADDGIRLGGIRMESAAAQLTADDTLETRLEQQKPHFRRTAYLPVL